MSGDAGAVEGIDGVEATERVVPDDEGPAVVVAEPDERPTAFKIVHPTKNRPRRAATPLALFPLNVLAGLLGIMSLAFAWNYEPSYRGYDAFSVLRYIVDVGEYSTLYSAIVLLVLTGSILCFITSLGGVLQLTGVLLFAFEFVDDPGIAGPGPFVAVAAALFGVASILLSPRVRIPSRFAAFVHSDKGGLSMNVLSLSAFVLGLLSMFMIWLVVEQRMYDWGPELSGPRYSLLAFMCDVRFGDLSLMIAGAVLISVGSVMCLLTPLGSLLQMVGAGLSFLEIRSSFGDWTMAQGSTDVRLGEGFYLAVAAAIVGAWSMVFVRRVRLPGTFVSGLLVPETTRVEEDPAGKMTEGDEVRPSRLLRLVAGVPRMARVPSAVAMTLAIVLAVMAVPYAAPLSTIEVDVANSSLVNIEVDVYIDGVLVASGIASPYFGFMCESKTTAGIHTVSLDYAYSSDEDPSPDGDIDWSSSTDIDPYMTSAVYVLLMGYHDASLPEVTLSCAPASDGYVLTFEEIVEYNWVGEQLEGIGWSDLSLVVADDYGSGVGWSFVSGELDEWPYDQQECGIEYLGDLGLNCTAYDLSGNGEADVGDSIRLAVFEGEFSASAEYIAYLLDEPTDSVIGQVILTG